MSTGGNWFQTMLAVIGFCVAGVITAVIGTYVYMTNTPPLHKDPQKVPAVAASIPAQNWADAVERARQALRAGLVEQSLPGLSVAVAVDGEIAWAEGFGFADLEKQAPVTPQTRFRIGTASTVLTSAGAGLLLERGRLNLDEPIQAYVPEFPKKEWPVTLRQLMGHVSGLRSDGGDEGPLFGQHCDRPVEALPTFADGRLFFEPGTRFRFSRYGWIVVSAAIESTAKESFLGFMQKEVFAPLGMNDTLADDAPGAQRERATFYFPRFGADPHFGLHLMREIDLSCYAGSSVFVSTASDLARFGAAINGGKLLRPETVKTLQAAQRLSSGEETGYGLGWDLESVTLNGQPVIALGHDGAVLGGEVASLKTFPERGLAVAVIANISYADASALALKVAEAFAGASRPPR